jgi:hypothetical protein
MRGHVLYVRLDNGKTGDKQSRKVLRIPPSALEVAEV